MTNAEPVTRTTVDLSGYPDLVVVYLGMKAKSLKGFGRLMRVGREIGQAVAAKPDGLLRHENMMFALFPAHLGMRQYWRDLESLERWTREGLHGGWWTNFLKEPGGTAFWRETYRLKGGMEAIYDDMDQPMGFSAFAPVGLTGRHSARGRLDAGRALAARVEEQAP